MNEREIEYLRIISIASCHKPVVENFLVFSCGLYFTTIRTIEPSIKMNQKFNDPKLML